MTIEQLVKELNSPAYKTEDKKIMLLRKYLKTDYLDYELKISICERILKASRYKEVMGRNVYSPNGVLEYELKIIAILQSYFKDIKMRDDEDRLADFNLLEKNNISELLIKTVGEDITRFNAVYNMMASDMAYKESLLPWIDTKWEVMRTVLDKGLSVIDNPAIKEKMAEIMQNDNANS